jgi:WD40 repeat protein
VCAHVLCGHDSPVTSISYATDLDIVLSGSQSGLLCLHSVRKGAFIRSITHILGAPVDLVLATSPGYLIAHSWSTQDMHVFWINGQHRATVRTATRYIAVVALQLMSLWRCCMRSDCLSRLLQSTFKLKSFMNMTSLIHCHSHATH